MTRGLALVALLLVLAPAGAAADRSATGKAKLQVVMNPSLVVRGTQFVPGEQVTVTVSAAQKRMKRTVATGQGAFRLGFRLSYERCNSGLRVLAVGNRGSRAALKRPPMLCPHP